MKGHRMSVLSRLRPALLLAAIAVTATAVIAADPAEPQATAPTTAPAAAPAFTDRLFLAFAQDAALVPSQWWEGQIEYANGSSDFPVNAFIVRGNVAFRPVKNLEVGGHVGFGTTHASGALPDGTGATDLDVYGKWVFPNVSAGLDFDAGMLFHIPTGDDTAGLGDNSFSAQFFGGVRYRMESVVLGGHVGVQLNDDGKFQGTDLSGRTSFELGVSAIFPLANKVAIVTEAQIATARFEETESATQILGGVDWRAFNRGMFRAAVAFGLTDGAPNYRIILGYAYNF
jgi:hypothetical protein